MCASWFQLIKCFWFAGIVAFVCGLISVILDYFEPEAISTFFNVDPLIDYEETFVYEGEDDKGELAMEINGDAPAVSKTFY